MAGKTNKVLKPNLNDYAKGSGEILKPTLNEYVKGMGTPKFCPMCGKRIKATLYTSKNHFPFWDFTCFKCDFAGEIEPDVPIGETEK